MCIYSFIHFFIHKHFLSTCTPPPPPVLSCAGDPDSRAHNPRRALAEAPICHHGHTILWPLSPENFTSRLASPEDFFWNTPSKHQVLATLSPLLWRPVSDLITHQLKTEKESCLLLFTAHSLLKRTWGSWMIVVDRRKESPTSQKWAASFCLPNERPRLLNLSERQRDWLCHLELVGENAHQTMWRCGIEDLYKRSCSLASDLIMCKGSLPRYLCIFQKKIWK